MSIEYFENEIWQPALKAVFKLKLSSFRKRKSYERARELWLFCHDSGLDLPSDVMSVFTERIRSDNSKWEGRSSLLIDYKSKREEVIS